MGHALADPTRRAAYAPPDPAQDIDRLAPQLLAFAIAGMSAPSALPG